MERRYYSASRHEPILSTCICRPRCPQHGRLGIAVGFPNITRARRHITGKYSVSHHYFPYRLLTINRLQNKALVAANEIMNVFKSGDPASVKAARKVAEKVFGSDWERLGSAVYDQGIEKANIWGIGEHHNLS